MPAATIIADLRGLRFAVEDLPVSILGEAEPAGTTGTRPAIVIDTNAAGYGWFIDRTPLDDSEFTDVVAPSQRQATDGSPAAGRVDLLTVVMHEMGHLFGLPELRTGTHPFDVMADTLDLSTRRFPLPGPPDVPSTPAAGENVPPYAVVDEIFRRLDGAWHEHAGGLFAQVAAVGREPFGPRWLKLGQSAPFCREAPNKNARRAGFPA